MLSTFLRLKSRAEATRLQPVLVRLPLCLSERDAERAFLKPLALKLDELQYGRITGFTVIRDDKGFPTRLDIEMLWVTAAPRAFETIGAFLEALDAPEGSWLGLPECPELHPFGRAAGLGLVLDPRDASADDDVLDILEACTEALEGQGLYQGSTVQDGRRALIFYGESYNAMRNAMTFVISNDPRCRNAEARRLG